ncbi:MAG TPA: arginase, partial [Chitinophagaceae bacterium]
MSDYLNISDFLSSVNIHEISQEDYKEGQVGRSISIYSIDKDGNPEEFPDLDDVQIVLIGCGERRGSGLIHGHSKAPDLIRRQFYSLYYWHTDVKIADAGNIREGSLFTDSYAALKTVIRELIEDRKTVI